MHKVYKSARPVVRWLLICALLLAATLAPASQGQTAPSNESFAQFWTRFKAALAKDDQQTVAALAKFRIDDSTYLTDKDFLAKWYGELKRKRRCLARAKPVKEQASYSVFCGEQIFLFERIEGAWKFTGIGAND